MHNIHQAQTLLGFDFGMRRIGVAIGDTISKSAKPLVTIQARDGIPDWHQIAELITHWQIDGCIVGMPYQLDGSTQDITFAAKKFSNRLHAKYQLPVKLIDERLTTKVAQLEIAARATNQYSLDSVAACLILQAWLNDTNSDPRG